MDKEVNRMKKLIYSFIIFLLSFSVISCDQDDVSSLTYYGVAGYVDMGDDIQSPPSVIIPEIGWVGLPNIEVTACKDGIHIDDYEVQEGDILKIFFEGISEVSILESFPTQFGTAPTSISVFNFNNVSIEMIETGAWLFEVPMDDLRTESINDISDLIAGDTVYFLKNEILNKQPIQSALCEVIIETIEAERIKFEVNYTDISELLEFYYWGEATLVNNNSFD